MNNTQNARYTPDDLLRLAHELVQIDTSLSGEDVMGYLKAKMQQDPDGSYLPAPHSNALSDRITAALYHLLLWRMQTGTRVRPQSLECDVWRFQNKKEKWVAFVGLLDGRPYEIFTGLQDDDDGIVLPKSVNNGWIVKNFNADGTTRYDFAFQNRRGYKITVEGLSARFNKVYWNYAKLISGVLRYKMPVDIVVHLIDSLQLESDTINTWKSGVVRALKKYTNTDETDDPAAEV